MCYDNIGICINYIELTNLNVIYIVIGFGWNFISNLAILHYIHYKIIIPKK
jgi:hypothetical protein